MNESKLIAEVYENKILNEKVDPTPGEIAIDEYPSSRDPRVTHKISYCPKTNKIIDLAVMGNNLIERKEIDPADIHLYNTWYDDSTLKNIMTAVKNAQIQEPTMSDEPLGHEEVKSFDDDSIVPNPR